MPPSVEPVQQFSHPRCTGAIFRLHAFSGYLPRFIQLRNLIKNRIQACAARHHHASTNQPAFVKRSQRVQITIKGLIFRVPLQIKGHPTFHIINFMSINEVCNHSGRRFRQLYLSGFTPVNCSPYSCIRTSKSP